jgi:hypothetical protein
VSKIDTRAAVELGRYLVTPNPSGNPKMGPSRTSVSLRGNMAVADRDGGLAKVWARQPDCQDRNGNGTIDTSNGATFLPWGEDECLAWHIDLPRMTDNERRGPRVVQWTAPADPTSCTTASEDVWTVFCNENDDDATAWLVNGSDGSIKVEIPIEGYECDTYGPYGGAADANNDLWFVDRDSKQSLFRVQYDCTPDPANGVLCWEEFPRPEEDINGYGITVDGEGRVWLAGTENALSYYWPEKNEWRNFKAELDAFFATLAPPQASPENILRGLMMDENGLLWIATIQVFNSGGDTPGLLMVDTNHDPPALEYFGPPTFNDYMQVPAGISIDVDGYVWLVDTAGEQAFKIDPNDPANYERVTGLELPYTYSDMTGFGLKTVVGTPVG